MADQRYIYVNGIQYATEAVATPNIVNPKANYQGAPVLPGQEWDVHGTYNWALNLGGYASNIREYVPVLQLEEYDLTSSSQLNAFKLFLSQTQSQFDIAKINAKTENNIASFIAKGVIPGNGSVDSYVGLNNGTAQPGGFSESDPYYGMYQGKKTGNMYYLPYLNSQNMTSNLGTWKGIDGSDIASAISKVAGDKIAGLSFGPKGTNFVSEFQKLGLSLSQYGDIGNVTSGLAGIPGVTKETIKTFTPNDTGDTITTTFYLFNTENVNDLLSNWEFLFWLTYQNLPNRKSLSRMDPPCIYTVTVPGFKRFPVAVINGLKVDNIGTTRLVDITTGEMIPQERAINNKNIKIIPEAYKVTITIQSLLINSRNLFYYNYDPTNTGTQINVISDPDNAAKSNENYNTELNAKLEVIKKAALVVLSAQADARAGVGGDIGGTTKAQSNAVAAAQDKLYQANEEYVSVLQASNNP